MSFSLFDMLTQHGGRQILQLKQDVNHGCMKTQLQVFIQIPGVPEPEPQQPEEEGDLLQAPLG